MQFSYAGIQLSLKGFQKLLHGGGGWLRDRRQVRGDKVFHMNALSHLTRMGLPIVMYNIVLDSIVGKHKQQINIINRPITDTINVAIQGEVCLITTKIFRRCHVSRSFLGGRSSHSRQAGLVYEQAGHHS